jgi:hypothetical protein
LPPYDDLDCPSHNRRHRGRKRKRGSDYPIFTWERGDGTPATAKIHFNDGTAPDPYPSPGGTFPFTETNSQVHRYSSAGRFDLRLTVRDDDGRIDNDFHDDSVNQMDMIVQHR